MKLVTALKHLFIPHEHNDYKPHFFREISIAIIVAASMFLLGVSFGSSFVIYKTVLGANVSANVLVDLTNESRIAYNEAPLSRSQLLDQAAVLKATDMSNAGYFAHNSPAGVTPWHWFQQVGYTFLYAGENLAINFSDAQEVRDAWLASPTHRANLLDVKFKEIGMATLSGMYKNDPTIYVVQLFGTPARAQTVTNASREETPEPTPKAAQETVPSDIVGLNAPEIKGEQADAISEDKTAFEPIVTTTALAIVKNSNAVEASFPEKEAKVHSTWYERMLFGGTYYIGVILKVLLALVLSALIAMIVIEIRRQHWKHIAYGLALLLIIALSIIINQTFW